MMKSAIKINAKRIVARWSDVESPQIIDVLLMVSMLLMCTVFFLYGDVEVTIEHSFNLLDSILSGRFLEFYQIAIENSTYGHPAVYDFPIYVVFAIWNLPVYILHKMTAIDYLNSFGCLLWSKMMMVTFTVAAAYILTTIGKELHIDKGRCKWIAFLFMTSSMVVIPSFMIVQYDIVAIVFMLLGIRAYMRDNVKGFVLWFALANTMKLFGVFIFIPLIFLQEKRIFQIIIQAGKGVLGIVFCKVLFGRDAAYIASTKAFSGTMLERMQATGFTWQYNEFVLPIYIVLIIGICIFAYAKTVSSKQERNCFGVYIPLVVFLGFIVVVPYNPYWMILAAPYMVLMPFITPRFFKTNMILEIACGALSVCVSVLINYLVFGKHIIKKMLLGKFISSDFSTKYYFMNQLLADFGIDLSLVNIVAGMLFACALAIFILNYPLSSHIDSGVNQEKLERGLIWIHAAVPGIYAILMLLSYVIPAAGLLYSSVNEEAVAYSEDLLEETVTVEEIWRFDDEMELKRMELCLANNGFQWIDSSIVEVSLTDLENGEIIWEEKRPANLIEEELVSFEMEELVLEENHEYKLCISAYNGEGSPLSVKYNQNMDIFTTLENGNEQMGDVCLNLYGVWK